MKLTWYGHACFRLESPDGTVVFDPYEPGSVPGLRLPELRADAAIYSHGHSDHYSPESVTLSGVKPAMKLRQMATWHDRKRGELRGSNIVSAVTTEGMTLVHLGDLGHDVVRVHLVGRYGVGCRLNLVAGGAWHAAECEHDSGLAFSRLLAAERRGAESAGVAAVGVPVVAVGAGRHAAHEGDAGQCGYFIYVVHIVF